MMSLQCDVNTTESLQKLRERNELCDVVLVSSDGKQTLAHSCVLASHSSVIATVLQSRLAAEHDWSILRPLVININEVSVKDSVKEDSEGNMSIIEILISLMYGEIVNIATTHVRALNAYAHVLGLSDQIFACLEGVENRSTKDIKNKGGKKNIRTASKSNENEYEHIEVLSEISLENQIFPTEIPKSSQVKESDNSTVVQTYGIGENPDNVLSLSLSPEGQEEVDAFGKAWQEGTLSYEKPADIQGQECNIVVCKMDQDSMDKIDGAHGKNPAESAVLNITLTDQSNTNSFCGVTQPVHQPKKQPKKSFICSACNSAFQKCCDLVKHVQSLQHFTVQCPLCFTQIEDAESQRIHFAEHDQELPFFCIYCNLRFRTRAALTMHTPKHMTMKPFVCNDCGRGFKWRHALHAHLHTHSPTSRLLCDICGFSSKYITSFKAHLLHHSGQSFPCPHPGCSFTSNRKTHLNDHLATHSKTRVHQCEVCGHSFAHARNMHRHMRLHAPASNLLTCTSLSKLQCSFRTTRPDKLRYHLLKKHDIKYGSIPSQHVSKSKLKPSSVGISDQSNICDKSTGDNDQVIVSRTVQPSVELSKPGSLSLVENFNQSSVEVKKLGVEEANNLNFHGASINVNKFDQSDKLELIDSMKNENKSIFHSSDPISKDLSSDAKDEHFSALINSNIVELPEIQSLQSHREQSMKVEGVAEITDNFSPVFLIEPEIMLLEKAESSGIHQPSLNTKDEMHVLQASVLPTASQKILSVNTQDHEGQMAIIDGHAVDVLSYPGHCALESQGDPSLEGVSPSSAEASVSNSIEDRTLREVTRAKEEQCMESILDFMLNNVTS